MYTEEILSMPKDAKFLLIKRGLYWGPNYCGYTGVKAHAGVYTRDQAASRVHNDGEPVSAIPYDTAPEYSLKCDIHIKAEHLEARVKELEKPDIFITYDNESGDWDYHRTINEAQQACADWIDDEDGHEEGYSITVYAAKQISESTEIERRERAECPLCCGGHVEEEVTEASGDDSCPNCEGVHSVFADEADTPWPYGDHFDFYVVWQMLPALPSPPEGD